jgi:hypothetical protein
MTATIETMQKIMEDRYKVLREVLRVLSESELNFQPFIERRTIAEIMIHIFRSDSAPIWFKKFFYGFLNIFTNLVSSANLQPINASKYKWNVETKKLRKKIFTQRLN